MSIATDGYGPGQTIAAWGYSFLDEIIVKAKILLEMLKRTLSLSLVKMYDVDLETNQKEIDVEVGGSSVEMDVNKINIDLEMTKTNIGIEMEVVE